MTKIKECNWFSFSILFIFYPFHFNLSVPSCSGLSLINLMQLIFILGIYLAVFGFYLNSEVYLHTLDFFLLSECVFSLIYFSRLPVLLCCLLLK